MSSKNFELVFVGEAKYFPRYRKLHANVESARITAERVWRALADKSLPTACHTPIVYGPGCGPDGKCVQPW
jgi:hypothetical protein